jgi:hypothetical protein
MNFLDDWWSGFGEFRFTGSWEAIHARTQVLLEPAIDACLAEARGLTDWGEPPIPIEKVREVFLEYCAEAFDRHVGGSSSSPTPLPVEH